MKKVFRLSLPVIVILTMLFTLASVHPVQAVAVNAVVISQVYGGGGNSGATIKNDFIELFNWGATAINLAGWSVQYASAAGTTWAVTTLTGTIQPGKYYLIQEAAGAGGTVNLPTPDATGSIAMSATAGKVALVSSTTALTGGCPTTNVVDFVGFGPTTTCSETSPTAILSNTTAAMRKNNGAQDTNNNFNDFTVGTPNPRNSGYPFVSVGNATPDAILPSESSLLTVAVTSYTVPASTGITVVCNLAPIGGSATQTLYDDGTNGDAVAGDKTFSYLTTDVSVGTINLTCSVADLQGHTGTATITITLLSVITIGAVNGAVLDSDNGITHVSPYVGQTVTVKGVIYERTLQAISNSSNTYKGFFIQNTAATADTDPNTSDGLFVFMSSSATMPAPGSTTYTPAVGDEVVISGKISEYYNMTELTNPVLVKPIVRSGVNIDSEVAPVVANPPVDSANANRYWERLQGMRIQAPVNSIVLGGRNVFSPADAEVWLAAPDSTVALRSDAFTRRSFRDANPLDDNYNPAVWDGNGYRILIGSLGIKFATSDAQALITPVRSFSTLTNTVAGGLNYTFSKYRIEVSAQPTFSEGVDPATNNPPQTLDRNVFYTVADYNLENLYDYRDNPFSNCDFAGNTGCAMVAPFLAAVTPPYDYVPASDALYQGRLMDIATQVINDLHNPDIIMVQEVENQDICTVSASSLVCGTTDNADGKPDVLQELALRIVSLGGPAYDAVFDRNSSDLRGIAPAFLYRTDRVELLPAAGDPVLGSAPAVSYAGAGVAYNADVSNPKTLNAVLPAGVTACETSWVFPRAVDVGLFRIYQFSVGSGLYKDVYVLNNHFKSGPDTCVAHRTEQAKYNAALVAFIQAANPNARIVVGGDFNVYPRPDDIGLGASDQLGSLYGAGLTNLWDYGYATAPASMYSYVYLGMAQTLDQMFINAPMMTDLRYYSISHINSDFPADYTGDVARGTSDHDPHVAAFLNNELPTVATGGVSTGTTIINNGDKLDMTITSLTVRFDQAMYDPAGDTDSNDVTNPANFILVDSTGNGILTNSCAAGISAGNRQVATGPVIYDPATFTATFTVKNGLALHNSKYRLMVCGSTSLENLYEVKLAGDGQTAGTDYILDFEVARATLLLPGTGFPVGKITPLDVQTADKAYTQSDLTLSIPQLGVALPIVGVPQTNSGWDLSWLGSSAGWLTGSAYPTWDGNSVITAHVWDASNNPGQFYQLKTLRYGDRFQIRSNGSIYIYEVRDNRLVSPTAFNTVFKHETASWVTLMTCEGFNANTSTYAYRRMVRAVLVNVINP